jgi:predicted nucleotidyltransferase
VKDNLITKKLLSRLKSYFKEIPDIVVVYLFGSFVVGDVHQESDLDIAILFNNSIGIQEQIGIQNDLTDICGYEIDLAILNGASPVFIRQVIEKGLEVYCSNDKSKNLFLIRILNEYDDLKYFRRSIEENILKGRIYA